MGNVECDRGLASNQSRRFCRYCENVTVWKLDRNINHSCCSVCGSHLGMSDLSHIKSYLNELYTKRLQELRNEYEMKKASLKVLENKQVFPLEGTVCTKCRKVKDIEQMENMYVCKECKVK